MDKSPMGYLDNFKITDKILRLIAEIDEFRGQWHSVGQLLPGRLSALKKIATVESIGSSTRIEGAKLTDAEVERLLAGAKIHIFRTRDEQEVAGYAELMELIYSSWREITLTEYHIMHMHGVLLKYSDRDERHRGKYKTVPNNVEAFDEAGASLGVVFETAAPFDTPRMMERLVEWTNAALGEGVHHPLLAVAVFVVKFLAIHPFQDGNGRLSRALTTLLLLRCGYSYVPYSSLERVVERDRDGYYLALRRAQTAPEGGDDMLHCWVEFFLGCMIAQKDELMLKASRERLFSGLPPLSAMLVELARGHGRVTVSGAVKATGANRNTVKLHLNKLARNGTLKKCGAGRGTWYEVMG